MRLLVHDIAAAQPGEIAVVLLVAVVLDLEEALFSLFVLPGGSRSDTVVPVEVIVVDKVGSDRLKVDQNIVELLQNEETTGHALTTWDCITLRGACADHLEKVLGDAHVIFLVTLLANHSMYDSLEDVLLGQDTLHVLNELVSLVDIIILQVVDDEVEARLRDHVNQRRQHLKCVLTSTENHQIVSEKIVVLEEAA